MRLLVAGVVAGLTLACSRSPERAPPGVLVAEAGGTRFVADDENAYVVGSVGWTYHEQGAIFRVPLDGGPPETLVVGVASGGEAVDGEQVYVARRDLDAGGGAIVRFAKSGADGAVETLYTSSDDVGDIALDDSYVYWASTTPDGGAVMRGPKDGGVAERVVSERPGTLAVDDGFVYWTSVEPDGGCWVCTSVRRSAKDGGSEETLTTSGMLFSPITSDDGGVYWMNVDQDDAGALRTPVVRFDEAARQTQVIVRSSEAVGSDLAAGRGHLFLTSYEGVYYTPLGGALLGIETQLAASPMKNGPHTLAVRAGSVYWLDQGGNLMRIAAPP